MIKWVCLKCNSTKLGPSRPRKDDTVRYCLGCSEKSGRLVERMAPTLEKKRMRAAEKGAALRSVRRTRAVRADPSVIDGLDLPLELQRLCAALNFHVPALKVRRGRKSGGSGHAYYRAHRIVMTLLPKGNKASATCLLVHELAHLYAGPRWASSLDGRLLVGERARQIHHGADWRRAYARIALVGYKLEVPTAERYQQGKYFYKELCAKWRLTGSDEDIRAGAL